LPIESFEFRYGEPTDQQPDREGEQLTQPATE
jgi:hypothetical protein